MNVNQMVDIHFLCFTPVGTQIQKSFSCCWREALQQDMFDHGTIDDLIKQIKRFFEDLILKRRIVIEQF